MNKRTPCHAHRVFATLTLASSLQAERPDLSKMNILFICPEDCSTEPIWAYGNKKVITANIDQLATRSNAEQNNLAGLQDHTQRQKEMANTLATVWQAALPKEH